MAYRSAVKASQREKTGFEVVYRNSKSPRQKFDEIIDDETILESDEKQIAFETAQKLGSNIIESIANSIRHKMKTHKSSGTEISIQIYLPLYIKDSDPKENRTFNIVVNGNEYNFTWANILENIETTDKFNRSPLIVELNNKFMKENNNELFIIDKSLTNFENNASDNKEQFLMKHYFYIYLMTREGSSRYNVYTDGDNVKHFINKIDCLTAGTARAAGEPEHMTLPTRILPRPIALPPPSITESATLIPKFENTENKYKDICDIVAILGTMSPVQVQQFKLNLLSKPETRFDFTPEHGTFKTYLSALKTETPEEKDIGETDL